MNRSQREQHEQGPLWLRLLGYPIAVAGIALVTWLQLLAGMYIPIGRFPITYVLLVMMVAYFFGRGPGLFAFLLAGGVFSHFFVPPVGALFPRAETPEGYAALAAYFLGAAGGTVAMLLIRRGQEQAARLSRELRHELEERGAAEEALRESQEDLNRAQAVAKTGSWRMDVRRNILTWSDETYRIFGIPKGTPMTYETFLAAVHPDDREYVDREWTAALRGEPYSIDHRIRVDDAVKWAHESAELEFDEQGQLLGGFGAVQDITERKQAEELANSLNKINVEIYSSLDVGTVMNRVVVVATQAMDADSAAIDLYEDGYLVPRYVHNIPELKVGTLFTEDQVPFAALAARERVPVAIENAFTDKRADPEVQKKYNVQAVIVVPLIVANEVIGMLFINYRASVHFTEAQITFARQLGASVSLAIANAKLFEEVNRERERVAAMESVAEAGIEVRETRDLLGILATRIKESSRSHSCTILMLDEETSEFVACAACNIPEAVGFRIKAGEGLIGRIAAERRTIYVRDAQTNLLVESPHIKRAGVKSLLGTPLIARGKAIGVVYINMMEIREYTAEEVAFFELMAARAALILENHKLYRDLQASLERERYVAASLQKALIPPEPSVVEGYRVAAKYEPGTRGVEIGGDFYDVFATEEGKMGIFIGDVSGKGVEAASLAAETRSMLRAFAYESSSSGETLTHTNAVLSAGAEAFLRFVTVAAMVLDPASGKVGYSSAGHPPALLYWASDESTTRLTFGEPPIGVVPSMKYGEQEFELQPGDRLVLYTDGLSEARRDGEFFGIGRIQSMLAECSDLSLDDFAERLISAAREWTDDNLTDDAAIIAVERI